jgi:hypothetical protein
MLKRFFAVTITSIYEITDGSEAPSFLAKKIALRGDSELPVGQILTGGTMVSIGKQIIVFIPEGGGITSFQRQVGRVNTCFWGGQTSAIVALFFTEEEARSCLKEEFGFPCDDRWVEQTKAVLTTIGDDHPVFSICNSPGLSLFQKV